MGVCGESSLVEKTTKYGPWLYKMKFYVFPSFSLYYEQSEIILTQN